MLLLKKLCRVNGAQHSSNDFDERRVCRQRNELPQFRVSEAAVSTNAANSNSNNSNNNNSNNNNNIRSIVEHQRINRDFCRTPPPVYDHNCAVPATPPPSYRQEGDSQNSQSRELHQRQSPEILPAVRHLNRSALDIQNDLQNVEFTLQRALIRNDEQLSQVQTDQQQRYNHQRRLQRQRLHWLQQQRRLININASSTDSSSSDSSASPVPVQSRRAQTQYQSYDFLQQRSSTRTLQSRVFRDAYCPDLLHACSLILNQERQAHEQSSDSSESSIGNFTDTPPNYVRNNDYVEIDNEFETSNVIPQSISGNTNRTSDENQRNTTREMGQNFSLRRPRISLTWVLREQQQQQEEENQQNKTQQQQKQSEQSETQNSKPENSNVCETTKISAQHNNNNGFIHSTVTSSIPLVETNDDFNNEKKPETVHLFQSEKPKYAAPKKRYRLKQLPGATEPLNGYATTPTGHVPALVASFAGAQKFFSSQNLPDCKGEESRRAASKELYFVCTPQRLPSSYAISDASEALILAKKRSEIQRRLAAKSAAVQQESIKHADNNTSSAGNKLATSKAVLDKNDSSACNAVAVAGSFERDELKSLKCPSYSEPSLIAISEGNPRRHRHRKRRDRIRSAQKFGYEISNVDEFLTKCSLASPGNIPVVLSTSSTLYQTRPGGYQSELPLPLGMVVNAVFKNQNWLYVQTPHAEEGYVGYACCLPLGILPPPAQSRGQNKPTPCWESNVDVFPRPCGNMTDSEKEIRLRGGTRSDGARTPSCGKRVNGAVATTEANTAKDVDIANGNVVGNKQDSGEQQVDRLYLRAASQPKLVEKAYAQLRSIKNTSVRLKTTTTTTTTDEYITLQAQHQQHQPQQQEQSSSHADFYEKPTLLYNRRPHYATNGQNGQHFHPKSFSHNAGMVSSSTHINQQHALTQHITRKQHHQQHSSRETLVAIGMDYSTESIQLKKGEIVTLCECRETKDQRQWFYVKARDGREGYIPAEVAGHGFL